MLVGQLFSMDGISDVLIGCLNQYLGGYVGGYSMECQLSNDKYIWITCQSTVDRVVLIHVCCCHDGKVLVDVH